MTEPLDIDEVKRKFREANSHNPTHIWIAAVEGSAYPYGRCHPIDLPGCLAWPHPEDCPYCIVVQGHEAKYYTFNDND